METTVSLNTKISAREKEEFVANAELLGMTPSAAIKVFVRMFNRYKGFPFDLRLEPQINFANENIPHARLDGAKVVVPASWRDDDE